MSLSGGSCCWPAAAFDAPPPRVLQQAIPRFLRFPPAPAAAAAAAAVRTGAASEDSTRVEYDSHSGPVMADAGWVRVRGQRHLGEGEGMEASTGRLKVEVEGTCHAPASKHLMARGVCLDVGRSGATERRAEGGGIWLVLRENLPGRDEQRGPTDLPELDYKRRSTN